MAGTGGKVKARIKGATGVPIGDEELERDVVDSATEAVKRSAK